MTSALEDARARLARIAATRPETAGVLSESDMERIAEIVAVAPPPSELTMNRLISVFRPVMLAAAPAPDAPRPRPRRRRAGRAA